MRASKRAWDLTDGKKYGRIKFVSMFTPFFRLKAKAQGFLGKKRQVLLPLGLSFSQSKGQVLWQLVFSIARVILWPFSTLKTFLIKILLKRGGFFSQPARFGLASVVASFFLSLIVLPNFQRAQSQIIATGFYSNDVLVAQNSLITEKPTGSPLDDIIEYSVEGGDTLWSIGKKFSVSAESLAYVNSLANQNILQVGQIIKIPPVEGLMHSVKAGETVSSIAQKYRVDPQSIVDFNYLEAPYTLSIAQTLVIPNATIPLPAAVPNNLAVNRRGGLEIVPAGGEVIGGKLLFPTSGVITQYFSWYHPAIDIANSDAPGVLAAESGTVVFAGWWVGGGGNSVWIDHGNGLVTKYGHLNQIYVAVGQNVSRGQSVGQMGQTGRAYGVHTHFIVEKNGRAINPLSVL